jgi:restriction endonuclease S subunit
MTGMQVKLGQIADIRTGYAGTVSKTGEGGVLLIQMGDLESLSEGNLGKIKSTNIKIRSSEWTLQEGDILIKARGTDFVPVTVQKELHGAVFTHPLLRLRLDRQLAVPEFIAWLLSQPRVRKQLQRSALGTSVQMLRLEDVKGLDLKLPSLPQQQKIGDLAQLMRREELLSNLLADKRKLFIHNSIKRFI